MTPISAPPARLFDRTVREVLDGAMSPDRAGAIVAMALLHAQRDEIPEDLTQLQSFVQGPLRTVLQNFAGYEVMETCLERLSQVLWMASSTVRSRASSPAALAASFEKPERDDPSGLRPVDPAASAPMPPSQSGPALPVPAPRARSSQEVPSTPRRSPTLGRLSMTQVKAGPVLDVSETLAPARRSVLVISLDGSLIREIERGLVGKRPVVRVASEAELVRAMAAAAADGFSVLVDSALPSVELGVFASLSSLLPAGTRVVLWGTDERHKKRLCRVFPQAATWIASGEATSASDLLTQIE